jgi:hypothetical protein
VPSRHAVCGSRAREAPARRGGHPAPAAAIAVDTWSDGIEDARSQPVASLPDLPERPAGSLPDVRPVVIGCSHDSRDQVGENSVVCALVVHGTDCNEDERGALYELFGSSRPFDGFCERDRGTRKQVLADLVTDLPAVEGLSPAIHLIRCHAFGFVDQRGEDACLANGCLPEGKRKPVIVADVLGQRAQGRQADPEGWRGGTDAFERLAVDQPRAAAQRGSRRPKALRACAQLRNQIWRN